MTASQPLTVAQVLARVLPMCDRYAPDELAAAWERGRAYVAACGEGWGARFMADAWEGRR